MVSGAEPYPLSKFCPALVYPLATAMCELTTAILVVLAIGLAWAYNLGWLNGVLPTSWQKSSFVGSMGRYPGMQFCLAFTDNHGKRQSHFNRCNYA